MESTNHQISNSNRHRYNEETKEPEMKKGFRKTPKPFCFCDPAGTRTQGPYIKSVLLYQLSYGILHFRTAFSQLRSAKVGINLFRPNFFWKNQARLIHIRCI
jgi:hypothetical protein